MEAVGCESIAEANTMFCIKMRILLKLDAAATLSLMETSRLYVDTGKAGFRPCGRKRTERYCRTPPPWLLEDMGSVLVVAGPSAQKAVVGISGAVRNAVSGRVQADRYHWLLGNY